MLIQNRDFCRATLCTARLMPSCGACPSVRRVLVLYRNQ